MIPATELLTPKQLAHVRKRNNWHGALLVAHAWGVIFGSMALFVIYPNPFTFLIAVGLIGTRQLGLAILMHDGAHGALAKSSKLNNFLSQWLCAYPVLAETSAYRRYHLKHHANTQQPEDPDLVLSAPFPITRKSFQRKMVRDLTGQTAYQQRKAQFMNAVGPREWSFTKRVTHFFTKLGKPLVCNLALLGILAAVGHWYLYFLLWLLPFMTWQQAITRIRNIAEHAMVPDDSDPFRNARTTKANWLERAFLAPYWVNYHVEHHLLMWVPCYNLPVLRRYLVANGYGERIETQPGYFSVLLKATSKPDDQDRPGGLVHNARTQRLGGTQNEGFSQSAS